MVFLKLSMYDIIQRYPRSDNSYKGIGGYESGIDDYYINTDTITEVDYTPNDNEEETRYGIIRFSSGEILIVYQSNKVFWNNLFSIINSSRSKTTTENFTYTTLHKSYGT